ncbi:MAG: WD40 repeat domain-containing protein, partial [Pirellulales bacterium]
MRSWLRTSLALLVCLTHLPSWANAGEIDGDSGSAPIVVPHIADAGPNAQCVALSADGQLVAAAYGGPTNHRFPLQPRGGGIAIYQRATGKRLHFVAEYGDIIQLQFSADGRALVYTRLYTPGDSVDDNVTVVLDTKTGAARQRWRVGEVAASVSASAAKDGDQAGLVAIRGGGSVELYDLKELAKVQQLDQLSARVIALSPKAERLAAITLNREGPSLRIIESATSRDLCSASDDDLRTALVLEWSADGKLLATGHAQGLAKLWRAEDLELLHTFAVETAAHVRPVFATASDALWLFSQPVQGVRWSYDRQAASGFKFESQRLETDAEA